jgi:hypothetical protein
VVTIDARRTERRALDNLVKGFDEEAPGRPAVESSVADSDLLDLMDKA